MQMISKVFVSKDGTTYSENRIQEQIDDGWEVVQLVKAGENRRCGILIFVLEKVVKDEVDDNGK